VYNYKGWLGIHYDGLGMIGDDDDDDDRAHMMGHTTQHDNSKS